VTECSTVLISEPLAANPLVREAHVRRPDLKVVVVPDRDSWLFAEAAPPYRYDKSFDEAENDPFIVVHTSGTTGRSAQENRPLPVG
jgi:acyl-coenzyme A synthetase/AMP-(fatty) acid ligase